MPPRIIVTRKLPAPVEAALCQRYDVHLNAGDVQFSADQLREALRTADIVLSTLSDPLDAGVLRGAVPLRARLLANFGVGFNHIDLAAAREIGLVVTNTPGVLTEDTADVTMLLVLSVARRASEGERELREGRWTGWRPTHLLGTRVHGATLGIVGYGRIGRAVARRAARGFCMRVLYHTPRRSDAEDPDETGATRVDDLDQLLAASDFVTLHCPATPQTRHLIDAARLARMKPTAFLVNTSRGDVVDQAALVAELEAGRIAGAALDVYEGEPIVPASLTSRPDVVLLPHIGSATRAAREAMGMRALANIDAFVKGESPPDRIA